MADFRLFFTRSTEADEVPGAKADFFNGLLSLARKVYPVGPWPSRSSPVSDFEIHHMLHAISSDILGSA